MYVQPETAHSEVMSWRRQLGMERSTGALTILFVEDESFVREVTSEVLRAAGYRVLVAENATEARQLYEQHAGAVDLLLTDLILSGPSGRQLAQQLRNIDSQLKVLFVSGYAEQLRRDEDGECLAKPFSSVALLEQLKKILQRQTLATAV